MILDALSLELAEPLLEWAPLVLVSDTALPSVLNWGTKIDVAFIQIDRLEELTIKLTDQFPVEIISCQNPTDLLRIAITFLIERKQKAVNIMTETSDSRFTILNQFMHEIQIDVFDQNRKWSCVSSGIYEKWLPVKSRMKIRSVEKNTVQFTGMLYEQEYWVAEKDGMVKMQSDQVFWVGEFSE